MKDKYLRQLAAIRKFLKDDSLEESFTKIEQVLNAQPEKEKKAKGAINFAIPMELLGKENAYLLYADGACRGNPGPGAFGCLLQDSNGTIVFEHAETSELTTNNQMELQGVIAGIHILKQKIQNKGISASDVYLRIFTDSRYVVDGITKWVESWKKRGWKKADNKAPENLSLWQELDASVNGLGVVHFEWVKGHAGHPQNEHCDQLANQALDNEGY